MNICKRTIIMAAGAALAALAVAGPASASTATQGVRSLIFPVKATTTDRTQAIGNGGVWARCGPQRWIDSSANGHGNQPLDGNIIGC